MVRKICHLERSKSSQTHEMLSLALKKACHCEDERSEDVAIAKSLNIDEITTQSPIARNDKYLEGTCNFPLSPLWRADLRTNGAKRVRIASRLSTLLQATCAKLWERGANPRRD